MTDKLWKRSERRIAKFLGGRRIPVTGRNRGDVPDIDHDTLAIEAKLRERLPAWILDGLDQAEQSATPGQLPCLVLRQKRQRVRDAVVCLRLSDFADLVPTAEEWDGWTR